MLFLVPYVYVMWVITRMQVMLSSICSSISSCGAVDSCGEIIVCYIYCVTYGDITSSCYWILRLFVSYGAVSTLALVLASSVGHAVA